MREADDPIEREGVSRARQRAAAADMRLFLLDATKPSERTISALAALDVERQDSDPVLLTKCDLAPDNRGDQLSDAFQISGLTGQGIEDLLSYISGCFARLAEGGESAVISRERHRNCVDAARAYLLDADRANQLGPELAAENLRLAARALEQLLGRVDVEDLLDVVFREFCMGK